MKQVKFTTLFVLFIISSILMSACTIPALGVERGRRGSPLFDVHLKVNSQEIWSDSYGYRSKLKRFTFGFSTNQPRGSFDGVWSVHSATWHVGAGKPRAFKRDKRAGGFKKGGFNNPRDNSYRMLTITVVFKKESMRIDELGQPEYSISYSDPVSRTILIKFYRVR